MFDPRGGYWMGGKYVPSLLAAIGEVIERHMIEIGFLKEGERPGLGGDPAKRAVASGGGRPGAQCPRCGEAGLVREEGCDVCASCGWSRCG